MERLAAATTAKQLLLLDVRDRQRESITMAMQRDDTKQIFKVSS